VSMDAEVVRNANAERQSRYRQSPAGRAAAVSRNKLLKAARLARRNHHFQLKNRARALGFDGVFGGPVPTGVPRLGELKLCTFRPGVTR